VQFAPKTLAGFDRVTLAPGESKDVKMHVAPRALEYWSVAEKKWVRSDARRVRVGSSSRDLKLTADK
jgi:beta-glucosidase